MSINGLSLFSNVGVAETYLKEINCNIIIANELVKKRADFYSCLYPECNMICGDITDKKIYKKIINESIDKKIDFIIATPPCQGMSTIGPQDKNDERNYLIIFAIKAILDISPRYSIIENVPQFESTQIVVNKKVVKISDYIENKLKNKYFIKKRIINTYDYGVSQNRNRCIYLLSRIDQKYIWDFPEPNIKGKNLKELIGDLPSLDPYIQGYNEDKLLEHFPSFYEKLEKAKKVSKWHFPPTHKERHVICMEHTPEGCSALDNTIYYPKTKDGKKVKGFPNTYKRQKWDKPACTVTTYNGAVCSQNNVHPGRVFKKNGETLYSDARVFSIYELMLIMSLPKDWNIPDWADESLIRHVLGEGVPPLAIRRIVSNLMENINE